MPWCRAVCKIQHVREKAHFATDRRSGFMLQKVAHTIACCEQYPNLLKLVEVVTYCSGICHHIPKLTMRVFNIDDNLPPHWTQRPFEMESLLRHRRPGSVKIVVCKCIAGFACLNECHNICKPAHQMEHLLHPRAKRKSAEGKPHEVIRWTVCVTDSRGAIRFETSTLLWGISLREETTSVAAVSPVDFQTTERVYPFFFIHRGGTLRLTLHLKLARWTSQICGVEIQPPPPPPHKPAIFA